MLIVTTMPCLGIVSLETILCLSRLLMLKVKDKRVTNIISIILTIASLL